MSRNNTNEQQSTDDMERLLACELTLDNIKKVFAQSTDIIYRDIMVSNEAQLTVTLVYIDGMTDLKIVNDNIVCPLSASNWYDKCVTPAQVLERSKNGALSISYITETKQLRQATDAILAGKSLIVFSTLKSALIADTIGYEKRGITPAQEENTYRSGKDSFVETLKTNMTMVRRKIRSPNLVLEETMVGKQTETHVCVVYMQNICNDMFVKKIKKRLEAINQDSALSLRDIYTNVVKEKYTPFPVAITTEKPDVCCMSLLEGKIAILIDELPYCLVLPAVFGDFFQTTSDYANNFIVASFFRLLRNACFYIAVLVPGFFVAITTFHPEMIPYKLNIAIAASRVGTPFSMVIEILIMSFAFFVLFQASLQVSQTIGATISIVGGLVLGQAAITARIVSPATIVVVATAAISSMAIPNKEVNSASFLFQVLCTILSAVFGLLGVVFTLTIMIFMLAKLTPLDVPYLSPYTARKPLQIGDSIIKFPNNFNKKRPVYLHPKNVRRKR